ncbi:hypothetical protein D3C75_769590 [compost metagenome]
MVAHPRNNLQAEDRIATQLEEVIGDPHLLDLQHLGPDLRHPLFLLAARGRMAGQVEGGIRQGLAVELAIGRDRQALQADHLQRHHVGRQRLGQGGLELIAANLGGGRNVADQLLAGDAVASDHHGIADTRLLAQAGFDLAQLDAEAPHLHLVIQTPDVVQYPALTQAHQVPGTVETRTRLTEWVRHEPLGSDRWSLVIAASHAMATDEQLPGETDRQWVEVIVQHP